MSRARAVLGTLLVGVMAVTACGDDDAGGTASAGASVEDDDAASTTTETSTVADIPGSATTTTSTTLVRPRPDWIGTRVLPVDEDGFGLVQPTPPELVDRRFETIDHLPPPSESDFAPRVDAVPDDVLARSTWSPECPVAASDLRYVTLPFHGFDGERHTGELLVHEDAVDAVLAGFESLYADGFPIEEMRIVEPEELDAPPTGDGNNTTAFVCRPTRGSASWSEHAYGRAVDINPFHNPYVRGVLVLPELASAYVDRTWERPGMLDGDDVEAFEALGWGWGGRWSSLDDYMHVSHNGR